MNDLEYYLSKIPDPFMDDEEQENQDVGEEAYDNYAHDTVLNSIGKSDSGQNIDLLWAEVVTSLEVSELELFIEQCFIRMARTYRMWGIRMFFNQKDVNVANTQVDAVHYIEKNLWVEDFADSLKIDSGSFSKLDGINFKELISKDFVSIRSKLLKTNIPDVLAYYFKTCSKEYFIDTFYMISQRDFIGLKTQMFLK